MRITKKVTVNVNVPKFETVCKSMWNGELGDFTPEQWEAVGVNTKEALARTLVDADVRKAFDLQVAKLLDRKAEEWWFYPENLVVDVYARLSKKHWITVAGIKCFDFHYPEGM